MEEKLQFLTCGKSFLFWEDLRAMVDRLEGDEKKVDFFRALFIGLFDCEGAKNPIDGAEGFAFGYARDVIRSREEDPRGRKNLRAVVIFVEFRAMFDRLKTAAEKMEFLNAVLNYEFEGVEPSAGEISEAAAAFFGTARALIDAEKEWREKISAARAAAGRKGARVASERRAAEKTLQTQEPREEIETAAGF